MKFKFTIMNKVLTLLLISFLFIRLEVSAQNLQRLCGHDKVMESAKEANPNFDAEYESFLNNALSTINLSRQNDTVYTVQVVFHILHKESDPYQNLSDELVYSQLDALNRDFNMRNADTSDTRPIFKGIAANARIEFVLAKRSPNGSCSDGIIRKGYNTPQTILPIYTDFFN